MKTEDRIIFITGNSRSGTTLMMHLLNNHKDIHAINEPHFFETMWANSDREKVISKNEAGILFNRLLVRQREGFFKDPEEFTFKYQKELEKLLNQQKNWTKESVYNAFIFYETRTNEKIIPCEKTPQNVFYIKEILDLFPNSVVINMIRDPRDVLLSQKKKWQRPQLGAGFMTKKEVRRLKINYHPITISKLWNSAISAYNRHSNDQRVIGLKFEDLVSDTSAILNSICQRLQIEYEPSMLNVPFKGSSNRADSKDLGIRQLEKSNWLEKGLNSTELNICQNICSRGMSALGYNTLHVNAKFWKKLTYHISFPFQVLLSFITNLNRMRSIKETLAKRLGLS